MCICGYHPHMGEGLKRFGEGLTAALLKKARDNSRPLGDQLSHEQDEIQLLTQHLESVVSEGGTDEERQAARGFLGIVNICRFLLSDFKEVDVMQGNLASYVDGRADALVGILKTYEDTFEQRPSDSLVARGRAAWRAVVQVF